MSKNCFLEDLMCLESGTVGAIQKELVKEVSVNSTETTKSQIHVRWLNTLSLHIGSRLIKVISTKSRLFKDQNMANVICRKQMAKMQRKEKRTCWKSVTGVCLCFCFVFFLLWIFA